MQILVNNDFNSGGVQFTQAQIASFLRTVVTDKIFPTFALTPTLRKRIITELDRLERSNLDDVQLPYIKFPRDPDV